MLKKLTGASILVISKYFMLLLLLLFCKKVLNKLMRYSFLFLFGKNGNSMFDLNKLGKCSSNSMIIAFFIPLNLS